MPNYVTRKNANSFKKALKESFDEVFEVSKVEDLTKKEQRVYHKYLFENATAIYEGQAFKHLTQEEQITYLNLSKKLNGKRANDENTKAALSVLKTAYQNHLLHTEPKWYQLFKRYAYNVEKKAIESFEEKLMAKGVMKSAIEAVKESVEAKTSPVEELKLPETSNTRQLLPVSELELGDEEVVEYNFKDVAAANKVLVSQN